MRNITILLLLTIGLGQDYSLSFDGVDDYVYKDDAYFDADENWTVLGWINTASTSTQYIFSTSWSGNHNQNTLGIRIVNSSISIWRRDSNQNESVTSNYGSVSTNIWHQIAVTYDGLTASFYIDGSSVGSESWTTGTLNSTDIAVGVQRRNRGSVMEHYFNGNIDEFSVWDHTLSESEMQFYMATPPTGNESGLVGYWNFNEGSGAILYDQSGNENHGTIQGNPEWLCNDIIDACGVCGGDDSSCSGCTDPEACNYDETATNDDGSCEYEVDCAGECGGDAVVDECGVCNGDGSSCSGSAHLEIQNVNLTAGTLDIYMENDVPVAGFEFYLSGMTITNLSDGTANEYLDFVEFHSPIGKILGVSISGATIPTGVGVLTTVSFIEFGEDSICFVDDDACANSTEVCEDCTCENNVPVVHIIAGSNANEIPSTWGDCFVNDDNWVYGCTYDTATNYNPDATFDDGSCDFIWGDMNHDGTLNVQDVIFLVNAILSGDWF